MDYFYEDYSSPMPYPCDRCGQEVYGFEIENFDCYETPDGRFICFGCVSSMNGEDMLAFLGCKRHLLENSIYFFRNREFMIDLIERDKMNGIEWEGGYPEYERLKK